MAVSYIFHFSLQFFNNIYKYNIFYSHFQNGLTKLTYFEKRFTELINNMIDKINKVKKFHEAFLIGNEDKPRAIVDESIFLLRHRLMQEENQEYLEACKNGDLVEIADALGDM